MEEDKSLKRNRETLEEIAISNSTSHSDVFQPTLSSLKSIFFHTDSCYFLISDKSFL